jgi:hypothetical protein
LSSLGNQSINLGLSFWIWRVTCDALLALVKQDCVLMRFWRW